MKRIAASPAFQETVGTLGAWYLKLVWHTSRVTLEPPTIYETVKTPAIIAMWHGQHFMMPFIKKKDADHRADVPKIARVAGLGVVKLAQHSGKPIYAVAIATSRRIELDNWDRTAVNLPFSHISMVASEAITVPKDADAAELEKSRQFVESELNRLTKRAYEIVDRKGSATP
jgi:lysophospholipid acyltransferase (LPLAT)-like uncharacterized protein